MSSLLLTPFTLPRFGHFLPTRILPGPMEGVTTGNFLSILTRHGWVRAWWTPFLRISVAVPRRARLQAWLAPYRATGLPCIVQLMGTDTRKLVSAARILRELGAAAIDLNCACPSEIVVRNGAGGARLADPSWIGETLTQLKEALDCPVGVKMRTGLQAPEEFPRRLAPVLDAARPDFLTLHYRTVQEAYRPVPRGWLRLKEARELLPDIPLVGSGDLFTPQDALRMAEECRVDALAPARGLLKNPRLLTEIRQTLRGESPAPWTPEDKQQLLREFQQENTPLGFLLQMAANLLDKDSPQFQDFLQDALTRHP
ncbi:MAG: tRNA dihydrouridine synthase [Oligosphaeraceae bacterium]